MTVRRLAIMVSGALLAAPLYVATVSAAPQSAPAGDVQVDVDPVKGCILVGEYPQFQGSVAPMEGVTRVRLFFRSALSPDFFFVEAVLEGGRYVSRIPRPTSAQTGPVQYYLEATRSDLVQGRSGEGNSIVVRKVEECPGDRKAAPVAPGGPVSVFDVAGNPAFPAGFEGVMGATAAGGAAVGAAAGGGSFFTSTAGLITAGAIVAGVTTAVIVANQSGSR